MKLPELQLLSNDAPGLSRDLQGVLRDMAQKVNQVASGTFVGLDNATDTVPSVAAADGDFIKKKTRTETGSVGSKYILDGWECVGGVWKERRFLTGN